MFLGKKVKRSLLKEFNDSVERERIEKLIDHKSALNADNRTRITTLQNHPAFYTNPKFQELCTKLYKRIASEDAEIATLRTQLDTLLV